VTGKNNRGGMEEARDTRLLPQRNEIGGWDDHSRAALGRLGFGLDGAGGRGERSEGERGTEGVGQPSDFAVRHSIERGGETHGDGGTLVWIELGPTIRRSPSPRHKTGRRGSWEWRDVSGGFRRAQWPLSPLRDGTKAEGRLAYLGWVKKEVVKKSKIMGTTHQPERHTERHP